MPTRYKIQGAPELASRLRRALDQQDISGGELELTFSPEVMVKDASVPPFVQDPVYWACPAIAPAVAAEFPHAGIRFLGPGLCVLDKVLASDPTTGSLQLRFGRTIAALTPGIATIVHDRADLRGVGVDTVALSSIVALQTTNAAAQGTMFALQVGLASTVVLFHDLNVVLAPGDDVFLTSGVVNTVLTTTFLGRWFPNAIQS